MIAWPTLCHISSWQKNSWWAVRHQKNRSIEVDIMILSGQAYRISQHQTTKLNKHINKYCLVKNGIPLLITRIPNIFGSIIPYNLWGNIQPIINHQPTRVLKNPRSGPGMSRTVSVAIQVSWTHVGLASSLNAATEQCHHHMQKLTVSCRAPDQTTVVLTLWNPQKSHSLSLCPSIKRQFWGTK